MKGARKRPAKRQPEQIPFKFAVSEVDHAARLKIENRRHALIHALISLGKRRDAK